NELSSPSPSPLEKGDNSKEITLFALAEPQMRTSPMIRAPTLEPRPGVLGRAVAPEQTRGLVARFPLLCRDPQPRQKLCVLLALTQPLLELRPPVDERLMHQLHGRALPLATRLDEQQPRVREVTDHLLHGALRGESAQLGDADHRARPLRRDEAQ